MGAGTSSALDAIQQSYSCPSCTFNFQQNVGMAGLGGVTGIYGTGFSQLANVEKVSFLNLYQNLKNYGGIVIFGNQQLINQAGGNVIKKSSENKEKSK